MFKHYSFTIRGQAASRVFDSLRTGPDMKSITFAADRTEHRKRLVSAASIIAEAESRGGIEVNKHSTFRASRIDRRKSRSGHQLVLPNIPLGWEPAWGPSCAANRCPVCGWPREDRRPPREVVRCASDRLFSSMDGYLVVWHEIAARLEREAIRGVSFIPVRDRDVDQLTVSVYSGSFEVNRRRLIEEFPSQMRALGDLGRLCGESVRVLVRAIEEAIEEQFGSRDHTALGTPEEAAWIRLPPWMLCDPAFDAFRRFGRAYAEQDMMDFDIYPPPPPGREAKWYVLLPDGPPVPEHETTKYEHETACPECGLRPAVDGPLRVPRSLVEGREIVETAGHWIVASDRVCSILREYDPFAMAPVALVDEH